MRVSQKRLPQPNTALDGVCLFPVAPGLTSSSWLSSVGDDVPTPVPDTVAACSALFP